MMRTSFLILAVLVALLPACGSVVRPPAQDGAGTASTDHAATEDELELYELFQAYRAAHRLPPVPLSRSLTKVARLHARDLGRAGFGNKCNIHSWSGSGPWKACCYRPDHSDPHCMWNKPRELTAYKGLGFELAYWTTATARPGTVMNVWKHSETHDSVILNRGRWRTETWRSVGVGIEGQYAVLWLGLEADPAGYWRK